jgi:UDP-N-acetylmuramate dehydrogenase
MNRRANVPLSELTTMKVGGPASFLVDIDKTDEIGEAIDFARRNQLPIFVLGGGSNVIAADGGFPGVVLRMRTAEIEWREEEDGTSLLIADAGVEWDELVSRCVERGVSGMENLSGIPGSVGASPVQNIGAYGKEVKDFIRWVETFDMRTGELVILNASQCAFAYRESVFKHRTELIVTRVAFELRFDSKVDIRYKDLAEAFAGHGDASPTAKEMRDAVLAVRAKKFPDLNRFGTAGSFFKNPIISNAKAEELRSVYPELPVYPAGERLSKISAAWIIDHIANMKGVREGDIGTWDSQALVLVNYGNASSAAVDGFARKIVSRVDELIGIRLEREVVAIANVT